MKVPAKIEQLDALTGLRGLAALWVALMHFGHELTVLLPASAGVNWFIGEGAEAVPLFFILSGFILLHTYRAHFEIFSWRVYFQFIWLRLARIYPTYLATLGLMVALVVASTLIGAPYSKASYPLARLPWEALMLHRWWWTDFFGWNYPDWSISAEWFAYLFIFPIAVWLLKKLGGSKKIIIGLVALGLIALEPAVRTEWKISMVSLLFLAGAFIWELRRRLQCGKKILPHLDLLAGALCFTVLWFVPLLGKYFSSALFLLAVGLLILGLSRNDGHLSRLLAWTPIFFLGEISYSLYLTHGVAQRVLKIALPAEHFAASSLLVRIGLVLTYAAALFALSLCVYYAVERPARKWLRRVKVISAA
jgi:peptidoglycan/LPS O-acetylase OafA/YrhL